MRLSENQWQTCLDTVKETATNTPEKHERTLFIISALYLFDDMLIALKRYRISKQLSPLPSINYNDQPA